MTGHYEATHGQSWELDSNFSKHVSQLDVDNCFANIDSDGYGKINLGQILGMMLSIDKGCQSTSHGTFTATGHVVNAIVNEFIGWECYIWIQYYETANIRVIYRWVNRNKHRHLGGKMFFVRRNPQCLPRKKW